MTVEAMSDQVQGVGYSESVVETNTFALELETDVIALELETDASTLELKADTIALKLEIEIDVSQEITEGSTSIKVLLH
jgi:hypothetical protein